MPLRIAVLSLAGLIAGSELLHADVTYGVFNGANCLPFMCNNSGTGSGQSIDYQQVYAASGFAVPTTIFAAEWYLDAADSGSKVNLLGGTYALYWGYAALNSVNNLSTTLAGNYIGGPTLLGTDIIPAGGEAYGPVLTMGGFSFTYNPALGNLLFEVVVSNQDNVANTGPGGNTGYNQEDNTGTVTSRAFCVTGAVGCFATADGLVTTFVTTAAPEPGTLGMLGGALLGLCLLRKRFSKA